MLTAPISAQDNNRNEYQKQLFALGKNTVKNYEFPQAIKTFTTVYNIKPKSETAQIAIKKSDSLKSILRKHKTNSLLGTWKWISKEANWAIRDDGLVGKMITITTDEIFFFELYRDSKKWELVKTEKIKFSENPESYSFTDFSSSNKEVWDYTINKDSGELTAFYIGNKTEEGFSEMVCGNPVLYYYKLH